MDNLEERFPLVDEEGTVVGVATRVACHNGSRLLHPVVHLHVFNAKGELYLLKPPLILMRVFRFSEYFRFFRCIIKNY